MGAVAWAIRQRSVSHHFGSWRGKPPVAGGRAGGRSGVGHASALLAALAMATQLRLARPVTQALPLRVLSSTAHTVVVAARVVTIPLLELVVLPLDMVVALEEVRKQGVRGVTVLTASSSSPTHLLLA